MALRIDRAPRLPPVVNDNATPSATSRVGDSNPQFRLHGAEAQHPTSLGPEPRAAHVLEALKDYNQGLIKSNPVGARAKFSKLTTSPFVFFRGTADLFYRDLKGSDANLPRVLCNGDVHPENFGVMQSADGKLVFGLNDFDEALHAPFSWDVKRGSVGLDLAAHDRDFSIEDRGKITQAFVQGYLSALADYRGNAKENRHRFTENNSPRVIRKLLQGAGEAKRKSFLKKRVRNERFLKTDELRPLPGRVPEFQAALNTYRATLGAEAPGRKRFFKVKDVAAKTGSGTGSVGLWRYYVLVEGKSKKAKDDVILEIKHERPSALKPHVTESPLSFRLQGARVVNAHRVQTPRGDRLYGHTELNGASYLVRERSPHKERVDLGGLSQKDFASYAEVCGAALAQAHARSDKDGGIGAGSAEKKILAAISTETYPQEIRTFTEAASARITQDHASFRKAYKDGRLDVPEPHE